MEAGTRVVHPELGPGVVRRARRDGRALLVSFDSHPGLLLEVRAHELRGADAPAPPAVAPAPAAPRAARTAAAPPVPAPVPRLPFRRPGTAVVDPSARDEAARTLEALRLGVVPHADLSASSVGRDREVTLVRGDLDAAAVGGAGRVFLGDYGTGKTHLLELVEREALARGFVVGRATLEAQYVRPSHPMRVYRAVVTSLRYPDTNGVAAPGIEPLLRRAAADPALAAPDGPFADHLYLSAALHYYRALTTPDGPRRGRAGSSAEATADDVELARELLVDWLSGQRPEGNEELDTILRRLGRRGPTVYSLKDFQPWAHVYAYLLGGLSALARAVGYTGLVVLLDEAENYDLLGSEARAFAESVFRCLVFAALGPERVRFAEADIDKGGFPPQKRLPLMFRSPQHLYLVAAMTPSTKGEELLRRLVDGERLTELAPLTLEDYHELARRLSALFQTAYPEMRLPAAFDRPLAEILWGLIRTEHIESPREATKLIVEFLDLLRHCPDKMTTFLGDVARALAR